MLRKTISGTGISALALAAGMAAAQTPAVVAPRVLTNAQTSALVTLKGSTHPSAKPQYDRGAVPDGTPAGHMLVVLKRSAEQQAALDALLAAQHDPKSPSYHKWLSPKEFGARFGVADADIQSVTSYLASQGFAVGQVFQNKSAIEFSGTTGQVRQAFRTEIHSFAVNGRQFHANASDPRIPAALAPVVAGISSLNDFKGSLPMQEQTMQYNPQTHTARPLYTDPQNPGVYSITPGDLAKIYDLPAAYDGSGVTVGVIGDSNINLQILANYRTTFGLPANTPAVIVDGVDPGITLNADLAYEQIELIAAAAPQAKVNYYVSGASDPAQGVVGTGIDFATIRAVEDNAVQVLEFGFQSCEAALGQAGNSLYGAIWQQAAAQGITVLVSSGNAGSAGCDVPVNGVTALSATQGLAVNGYASTPYATAVGATDFYYAPGQSEANYWSATNGGAGGYTSALGYIPEQAWNNSYNATNQVQGTPVVLATGGGISTLGLVQSNNTSDNYTQQPWPVPSWQMNAVSGIAPAGRVIPDISIFGGGLLNGSTYALCIQATDCIGGSPSALTYTAGGGSTGATGAFAGIAALVVQAQGAQGNINPILYSVAQTAPSAFHDVTVGTNTVNCTTGSPNCAGGYLQTSSGQIAYATATGYDVASGLGSVDVANLIANWRSPASNPSTITLTLTQPGTNLPIASLHHGDPVQVNVTVNGSSGPPTGDVAIVTNSAAAASAAQERLTLSNGTAVDPFLTSLPGGTYQVTARYGGDGSFTPSVSAPVTVTVYQVASRLDVVSQSFTAGATVPYGTPLSMTLAPSAMNNANDIGTPTGAITIQDNRQTLTIAPLNSEGTATFNTSSLVPGHHSLFATYSGDASFGSTSLTRTIPVIVAQGQTAITLSSSDGSVASSNSTIDLIASVSTTASGTLGDSPLGSVKFTSGSTTLGYASVVPVLGGSASATSVANLRVRASALGTGSHSIIGTFSSYNRNYTGSVSAPITVTNGGTAGLSASATTINATVANATQFYNYSALSFNVGVTGGAAMPTGTVSFLANGISLGSADLSAGAVVFDVPADGNGNLALPLGADLITAQYGGDATHAASAAIYKVTILDDQSAPDFSLQTNQVYQTITPSVTTATFQLQFTSLRNFTANKAAITLTYTTPPQFACSGSPASPSFGNKIYASVTMTCTAASGFSGPVSKVTPIAPQRWWMAGGGAALACVFLFGLPGRRRSWQSLLGALVVLVLAFGVAGCGGMNMSNPAAAMSAKADAAKAKPAASIAPGTYIVLVTASAQILTRTTPNTTTTVVHTIPLKIVVQ
ncbi:MAG: Ig-like domain repeat protein [Acidobacteriaceae bacterium]